MNSVERFFDVWKENVIGNKDDLVIGLSQLDKEIRADERRKFTEWLDKNEHLFCHWKKGNETDIECVLREYGEEPE